MNDLRPVGTIFKYLSQNIASTITAFDLFEYKVTKHVDAHVGGEGSAVVKTEKIELISHQRISTICSVFFAGIWWNIPPKDVWEFCTDDHKDILKVLKAGIIKPTVWYGDYIELSEQTNSEDKNNNLIKKIKDKITEIEDKLNGQYEIASHNGSYEGQRYVSSQRDLLNQFKTILKGTE